VVGQAFGLFGQALGREGLQGLDDTGVQHPPPLVQQAAVGHLMGQRMLEGVFQLREEPRLVHKLGRLQVRKAQAQRLLRHLPDGLQHRAGHLHAEHRRRLQQPLLLRR
jgi:hypothetical protein